MADEDKTQTQAKSSRSRSRAAAAEAEAAAEQQNATSDAPPEEPAADAPEPPAAEEPGNDAPPEAEAPEPSGSYDKATLISRAESLLDVPSYVARGVLAEADDELTIDAAKARIQDYLDKPVNPNTEEA